MWNWFQFLHLRLDTDHKVQRVWYVWIQLGRVHMRHHHMLFSCKLHLPPRLQSFSASQRVQKWNKFQMVLLSLDNMKNLLTRQLILQYCIKFYLLLSPKGKRNSMHKLNVKNPASNSKPHFQSSLRFLPTVLNILCCTGEFVTKSK